jgi:UDP-glucose 4-epimerase
MDVLITGGAGFIGSHLADFFISRGDHVFVLDDLSTGSLENIAHLHHQPNFVFQPSRVEDADVLQSLADRADLIFHMAAAVGVRLVVENGVRAIRTNLEATMAVLQAAKDSKTPVFLASSSEVYGKSNRIPFEEDSPLAIGAPSVGRWSYACSKAMGEFLGLANWKEYDVPVVIGRLFNTAGPRQTGAYGMVVPTLVKQALAGKPLTVYGNGAQSRCFAHVGDVVRAITTLMVTPEAYGGVFNIGSSEETTIENLAERVLKLTGSSAPVENIPFRQAYGDDFEETSRRVPSLKKIKRVIGYVPEFTLDDIIEEVIVHAKEELGIAQ